MQWTPLKLGERMNRYCASYSCIQQPAIKFEAGGVESVYCAECAEKIKKVIASASASNEASAPAPQR